MITFITIFLIALAVTGVSTPWVRRVAIWFGFVDAPAQRKLHTMPIPLMGGLAILGGAFIAVLFFLRELPSSVAGVLLASTIVAIVGLVDDRRHLPALVKLAGQFAAFLILANFGIRVSLPVPEVVNYALTFLWLAGINNAVNFLDNMDG
jgi:UDP-GlcNAc:undecaprenyl-phosphate GlcNAc-1-phosphate transferase